MSLLLTALARPARRVARIVALLRTGESVALRLGAGAPVTVLAQPVAGPLPPVDTAGLVFPPNAASDWPTVETVPVHGEDAAEVVALAWPEDVTRAQVEAVDDTPVAVADTAGLVLT